jgi:diamine N-acetyltransferase
MEAVKLIRAGEDDLPRIASLAERIWWQHYPAIISHEQITYMLHKMYTPESLRQQIREGHHFYLVSANGQYLGFISVRAESDNAWFLNKFYIDQDQAGKGVGSAAFAEMLRLLEPREVTLTVNRQNYKSINFYFKHGFRIDRVEDFDIGGGFVMNDFVMKWRRQS